MTEAASRASAGLFPLSQKIRCGAGVRAGAASRLRKRYAEQRRCLIRASLLLLRRAGTLSRCAGPPQPCLSVLRVRLLVFCCAARSAWCAARRARQSGQPRARCTRARTRCAMSFFDLCVAVLLFFNAAAVLNEHRFLAKRA